jgi:aryl-alcohol dehydrogenase-like predicted oxidoreductase
MHRRDFTVPIEESAGAFAELIREGKIGGYGLSEMSAPRCAAPMPNAR